MVTGCKQDGKKGFSMIKQILRLKFELSVFVASVVGLYVMGLEAVNVKAVFYKLNLLTLAVLFAHISRKVVFPYVDMKELLMGENGATKYAAGVRANTILGIFLYYVGVIVAFMLGF
jgi:hypothetical protein